MSAPLFISCSPQQRDFPAGWKDIWFRRHSAPNERGDRVYECPGCHYSFTYVDLDFLQGDHIWPYSLFGPTVWDNYQLICAKCNRKKSNLLAGVVHATLTTHAFRAVVMEYLRINLSAQTPLDDMTWRLVFGSGGGPTGS